MGTVTEQLDQTTVAEIEQALMAGLEAHVHDATEQSQLGYARPPEAEVYGRSLTTIRRLGAFMIGKSSPEIVHSPEAAQARVEFYTSVEEGFGTDMELGGGLEVRDFDMRPVIDGKVMAKDLKTPISDMTEAGLVCAFDTARKDERFLPQLSRSKWDHDNALMVDKMARGETPYNTRIVVSPFPEEAAAQSGNAYWRDIGYVPHLRRGFVQLYHVTPEGTVISGSLSFDGSNKQKLRELFGKLGIEVSESEVTDNWLQYAITDTLSADRAKKLATGIANELGTAKQKKSANTVDVTRDYGPIMDTVFDESYVHICESSVEGRQTIGLTKLIHQLADKAHHFNERYATALYRMRADPNSFTDDDTAVLHELLVYSTIEMMRALHLNKTTQQTGAFYYENMQLTAQHLEAMDPNTFQTALSGFGAEGARNNRVYSACGLSISLGEDNPEVSPQTAFGGIDKLEGKKLMSCPFCKARVFDDPCAKVLSCWDCRARVVNGQVRSKGNGGSRARKAHDAERAAQKEQQLAQQVNEVFAEKGIDESVLANRGISQAKALQPA